MRKKTKVKYILLATMIVASNCIIPRLKTTKVLAANPDEVQRAEESLGAVDGYVEEKKITLKVRKEVVDTLPKDKFDIEILIDASGSMNNDVDPGALKAKGIINNFIDGRDVNLDNIGVSIFRGPSVKSGAIIKEKTAETVYSLGNNFDSAKATITNAYVGGFTPLLDGLKAAKADLDSNKRADSTRKVMIILGDGHPNIGPSRKVYYSSESGNYYGKEGYYPGDLIRNQIIELDDISYDRALTADESNRLNELKKQQELYPSATEHNISNSGTETLLNGTLYDNSKAEYYDLKYLVEQEVQSIKAAGYEVYTIYLNNEKPTDSGYVPFLANTNESENLFKKMATDTSHYFNATDITGLENQFKKVNSKLYYFDYSLSDQIEAGYELVPNSFTASIEGVAVDVQDNKIQWGIQGVENKELEVSYKIGRKTGAPAVKEGTLVVKHLEEGTGKELALSVTTTKPVGENYTTSKENIEGYEYVRVEGQASGQYTDGNIEVTYIYKKIETPVKEGTLVVKYLEEGTGKELSASVTTTKPVGDSYNTAEEKIQGYEVVRVEGQANGQYTDGSIEVKYIYKKTEAQVKEGTLVVKHLEEGTGKELALSVTTTKPVGENYTTSKENIEGYEYVRVEGQASGQYTDGNIEVKYIYKKAESPVKEGTLVVKHLEEGTGKELAPSLMTKEVVGESYSTAAENIEGYEFVKIEGQADGKYIDGNIEVKYIYRKIVSPETSNKEVNNKVKTPEKIVENSLPRTGSTGSLAFYPLGTLAFIAGFFMIKRKK